MGDAACQLADRFHFLRLLGAPFGGAAFREIACYLGKAYELAFGISDCVDNYPGPEPALVLAEAPAFRLVFAGLGRNGQCLYRDLRLSVFLGVEGREVPANDFFPLIAFGAFRSRVPVDDVTLGIKHVNGVVGYAFHQNSEAPLGVLQFWGTGS